MKTAIPPDEILATLRDLAAGLSRPVWLFGGVAVDFHVGRWTRPHGDIDLNAFTDDRATIERDLRALGFRGDDRGWLTNWLRPPRTWRLEIAFLERAPDHAAVVVVPPDAPTGVPGRHPTLPGYLDPDRRAHLGGVSFRVCSAAGEWLARAGTRPVIAGRPHDPKLDHDLRLLEGVIAAPELARLRALAARAG